MFLDQHRVTQITPGDVVTVVTERGSFRAGSVVLAVGPWAPSLCSSLGLHLPLEVHVYVCENIDAKGTVQRAPHMHVIFCILPFKRP